MIDNNLKNNIINLMKKLLLLLICLLFFNIAGYSDELPLNDEDYIIIPQTPAVYYSYMEDYAVHLKKAFEETKMFKLHGQRASYRFIITRNGEIKNMECIISQNKYFNKKIKEAILSVKPLPFREGMEPDELWFEIFWAYQPYYHTGYNVARPFDDYLIPVYEINIISNKK